MQMIHILEDDPVFRYLLKSHLTKSYEVKGYDSIEKYRQEKAVPDLLLLDFNLHDDKATTILPDLVRKKTRIIAMSSESNSEVWNFGMKNGVSDFYQKGKQNLNDLMVKIKLVIGDIK